MLQIKRDASSLQRLQSGRKLKRCSSSWQIQDQNCKLRLRYFDLCVGMSCSCVWGTNQVSVDSGADDQNFRELHYLWRTEKKTPKIKMDPETFRLSLFAECESHKKKKKALLHKHSSTFWCESFKHSFIRLHSRTWYEPEGVEQLLCSRVWSTSSRSEFLLWNVGGLFKKALRRN